MPLTPAQGLELVLKVEREFSRWTPGRARAGAKAKGGAGGEGSMLKEG